VLLVRAVKEDAQNLKVKSSRRWTRRFELGTAMMLKNCTLSLVKRGPTTSYTVDFRLRHCRRPTNHQTTTIPSSNNLHFSRSRTRHAVDADDGTRRWTVEFAETNKRTFSSRYPKPRSRNDDAWSRLVYAHSRCSAQAWVLECPEYRVQNADGW